MGCGGVGAGGVGGGLAGCKAWARDIICVWASTYMLILGADGVFFAC